MKSIFLAAALASSATFAFAAETYTVDASHSQAMFSYNHAGFSTTYGMFSGFEGEVVFDAENPAASSVTVSIPTKEMFTGWEARDGHLKSDAFFDVSDDDLVTFASTSIEVTGENTALITGDLTIKDITKSVVLDAVMNSQTDAYPFPPFQGKPALGFSATVDLIRSDFGVGMFAPFVADKVSVEVSIEAMKLD